MCTDIPTLHSLCILVSQAAWWHGCDPFLGTLVHTGQFSKENRSASHCWRMLCKASCAFWWEMESLFSSSIDPEKSSTNIRVVSFFGTRIRILQLCLILGVFPLHLCSLKKKTHIFVFPLSEIPKEYVVTWIQCWCWLTFY